MTKRKKLTIDQRRAVVSQRGNGVSVIDLAKQFGVTRDAIYKTLKNNEERKVAEGTRSEVIQVRVSPAEAKAFDTVLANFGISKRSDALRALLRAAEAVYVPDVDAEQMLAEQRAALSRLGSNMNQIARRLNEAKKKGSDAIFGATDVAEISEVARFVVTLADQTSAMVERKTERFNAATTPLLLEVARGS